MRWSCAGLNGMGGGGGGLKMFWIRACVCKLKRFTDKVYYVMRTKSL